MTAGHREEGREYFGVTGTEQRQDVLRVKQLQRICLSLGAPTTSCKAGQGSVYSLNWFFKWCKLLWKCCYLTLCKKTPPGSLSFPIPTNTYLSWNSLGLVDAVQGHSVLWGGCQRHRFLKQGYFCKFRREMNIWAFPFSRGIYVLGAVWEFWAQMDLSSASSCPGCPSSCFCGDSAELNLLGALCLQRCRIPAGQNTIFSCNSAVLVGSHLWFMAQRLCRDALSSSAPGNSSPAQTQSSLPTNGGYRGTDLIQFNKTELDLETPPFPVLCPHLEISRQKCAQRVDFFFFLKYTKLCIQCSQPAWKFWFIMHFPDKVQKGWCWLMSDNVGCKLRGFSLRLHLFAISEQQFPPYQAQEIK